MLPGSDIQGWWEQERQGSGRAFFPMPADHTSAMERSSECNLRLSTNSREFWWCWVSDVCMDWKEGRGNMGGEREGCARCSCVHSSWWHLVTNRMLETTSTPNQTAFWSNSLLCCWNAPAVLKQQSSADVTHWKHRVCLAVSVCVLLQMQLQYLCVSAGGEGLQGNVGVLGKMGKRLVSSGSQGWRGLWLEMCPPAPGTCNDLCASAWGKNGDWKVILCGAKENAAAHGSGKQGGCRPTDFCI